MTPPSSREAPSESGNHMVVPWVASLGVFSSIVWSYTYHQSRRERESSSSSASATATAPSSTKRSVQKSCKKETQQHREQQVTNTRSSIASFTNTEDVAPPVSTIETTQEDDDLCTRENATTQRRRICQPQTLTIAYASTTGTCLKLAQRLESLCSSQPWAVQKSCGGTEKDEDEYDCSKKKKRSKKSKRGTAAAAAIAGEEKKEELTTPNPNTNPNEHEHEHEHDSCGCSETHQTNSSSTSAAIKPCYHVQVCQIDSLDWWDEFLNHDDDDDDHPTPTSTTNTNSPPMLILIIPTWTNGTYPPNATNLESQLAEITTDWRIPAKPLRHVGLKVGVFGMGSSSYDLTSEEQKQQQSSSNSNSNAKSTTFCKPAKATFQTLVKTMGARPLGSRAVAMGDDATGSYEDTFDHWCKEGILPGITKVLLADNNNGTNKKKGRRRIQGKQPHKQNSNYSDTNMDSNENDNSYKDFSSSSDDDEEDENTTTTTKTEPSILDMEDMGHTLSPPPTTTTTTTTPPEMLTPTQAHSLRKEGYKLIGTHSAVKLCRWTKHQLRGRGGCYKHTFYGITSYQCMEATPSLACANKCVFCWRHHKNPVGKSWKWKTDGPGFIVKKAIDMHVGMMKEAKGIPGVRMDRWREALRVRHCALSLVGEPIMYPHIIQLLQELHGREISSFLVTNGQHPQAIETLCPVTQLYVSVDAPNPKALVEVDRPLFGDAWERLKESLRCLEKKGQRTVARLTVVKGWNEEDVEGYGKLIALGRVSLVEVKGVTFCGKSDASNLNMSNTPWHHEVVALTKTLQQELQKLTELWHERRRCNDANSNSSTATASVTKDEELEEVMQLPHPPPLYDFACEHVHSCSVLLARVDQFATDVPHPTNANQVERKWRTWIDYDKFHQLVKAYTDNPCEETSFGVKDYLADTPSWALFNAKEQGFDPTDQRHRKKTKHPKYTKFDEKGVPTHDFEGKVLEEVERKRLEELMEMKKAEIARENGGDGCSVTVSVTELKGGEKAIVDPSLMFRGLVVTKG